MFMGKKKRRQPIKTASALFTPKPLDNNTGFFTAVSTEANNLKTAAVRTAEKREVYRSEVFKIGLDVFGLME